MKLSRSTLSLVFIPFVYGIQWGFAVFFSLLFGAKNRMENSVCECLNLKMVCSDWNGMESIPNGNKSYTLNIIHKLFVSFISTLKVKLFNIIVTERLEWNACRRHRNSCVSKHFNAKGKLLLPTNIDDIFDAKKNSKENEKKSYFPHTRRSSLRWQRHSMKQYN